MQKHSKTKSYSPKTYAKNGGWDNDDILFDPISKSTVSSEYGYGGYHHDGIDIEAKRPRAKEGGGRFVRGKGVFSNIHMRKDEDESQYMSEFKVGAAKVLAVMQIVVATVIILIGVFAYVAKATLGPLLPGMDIACSVVFYMTGGILGLFSRCRAKRMVAAFVLLSACSFVASTALGAMHALAAFRTEFICAYFQCSTQQSSSKVMASLISILSFIEGVFALASVFVGLHSFCKCCHRK